MAARLVVSFRDAIVREVELKEPVTVVGRHPDCDVVIDHPAVSGRHLLLRLVGRTVYAEDLASTNGTAVNGLSVTHHVLHHLDMIEVGLHKLHFFEDGLLVGGLGRLEDTVQSDYERTMLAGFAAAADLPAQADFAAEAVEAPPAAEAQGTSATMPIALALRVEAGAERGALVRLDRANTLIGPPGRDAALVVRRGRAYYLARLGGTRAPRLNRREVGPGSHPIGPKDTIELGDVRFEVVALEG